MFISYRVASERDLAQKLQLKLSTQKIGDRNLSVFLDVECLNIGEDFEEEFLQGLQKSRLALLLISRESLVGIRENAASRQDNVLLEYEFALSARKRGNFRSSLS